MAKRLSWVLFSTFSNLRNSLRKGTSRVLFCASFSISLNMKNMSSFTFVGLVRTSNNDGLLDHDGAELLLLRVR